MKKRLLALIMSSIVMVSALTGCGKQQDAGSSEGVLPTGTFEGIGNSFGGELKVSVKLADGKIEEITILEHKDTPGVSDPAMKDIPVAIIEAQSTDVEVASGASMSSKGIMEAVQNALDNANGVVKEEVTLLEEPDVLIVGGGMAGMVSAITAAENGAKVIIFEKTGKLGGTFGGSTLSGTNTKMQEENGITDDSPEKFFQDFIRLNEGYKEIYPEAEYTWNEDLGRYYAEHSGEAVDWLDELGADMKDRTPSQPTLYEPLSVPRVYVGDRASYEEVVTKELQKHIDAGNVSVALNTKGEELLMNGKEVVGVKVTKADGTEAEFKADSTILATGGYGHSEELVKKYNFQNFTTTCPEFVTGDGHIMAEKAGAVLKNMDFLTAYSGVLKNEENGLKKVDSIRVKDFPYIIFVNENGERFIDELGNEDGSDYDKISSSWKKAKDNKVYIMLDQAMVDSLKAEGKSIISGDKDWSKFAAQLEKGEVLFTGSTIEEVAEKAGINGANLATTIERYNGFARNGIDEDFGRTRLMTEFTGGTYYVFETTPYLMITAGGPDMNDKGEVLNADGEAIPGLYQAGEIIGMANAFGRTTIGGIGNTGNVVWGKLAGSSAAEYAKSK